MQPGTCQPGADPKFAVPEDSHRSAHTQAFGQGAEDFLHATGGGFEAIQCRDITDAEFPGTARQGRCCPTGLALEIPDLFWPTMAAVADEGVDVFIGNAIVPAVGVGTGKPGCRDPFLAERATRASYL